MSRAASHSSGSGSGSGSGSKSGSGSSLSLMFTLGVLAAMMTTLAYVRFVLLPSQDEPQAIEFHFRNPILDARPGDRVLFVNPSQPGVEACIVARKEGLVLRPHKGPERIRELRDLRKQPPYLACAYRNVQGSADGGGGCGGEATEFDLVLYGVNSFGMQVDHKMVVESIMPQRKKWGGREIVVYRVEIRGYGGHNAAYTTLLTEDAPLSGMVHMQRLAPDGTVYKYTFREILGN